VAIPIGRDRLTVKPSAQPTLVRTQHLPPPAKTARDRGIPGLAGRLAAVPLCVMMCRCAPLHSSGYGHMADGFRPEQAVHRTACSWISTARRPLQVREDHWWADGLAHAWPTGSVGSRENPAGIEVSPWTGRNRAAWRLGASFACHARTAGRASLGLHGLPRPVPLTSH
jgi:hypothetical protein